MLTLSLKERDRLVMLRQVHEKQLTVAEGARRLRLSTRHMRRLLRRFEQEGDAVVVHGLRARPGNRRLSAVLREQALAKAREELYQDFGPTLLSEHLERDPRIGFVHPSTLRLWMIEAGLWEVKRQGTRHRKRRERRRAFGELVLMDTSIHAWLEGRSAEEPVLIALIDDATSRLYARFFPRDTGAANRQMLVDYMQQYGRMGALYVDRASHFEAHFRAKERRERDLEAATTLIQRGLDALGIELILALSPQAKGRVERLFGTLQDRLIKEMRVAGISTMEAANHFLGEVFIPFWDGRFTHEPLEAADAHQPVSEDVDLLRLFAETDERVIRSDFTFRYKNVHYQIEETDADGAMPRSRITIEQRLDDTTRYRWQGHELRPRPLGPKKPEKPKPKQAAPPSPRRLTGAAGKPLPPDHPWRRFPVRVGRARYTPLRPVVASASLRPDSPVPVGAGDRSP